MAKQRHHYILDDLVEYRPQLRVAAVMECGVLEMKMLTEAELKTLLRQAILAGWNSRVIFDHKTDRAEDHIERELAVIMRKVA